MRGILAQTVAVLLMGQNVFAAEPSVTKTDWAGFQERVGTLKLKGYKALILLDTGNDISAYVLRVEANGLVVRRNRVTKQWATTQDEAILPQNIISSVHFSGRRGRHGLIGGLAGLGAGIASNDSSHRRGR